MPTIATNARTAVRIVAPDGADVQPWTVEFVPSDSDLVRLYSVDGDPHLILIETHEQEGAFVLTCYLGPHGEQREPAGRMEFAIDAAVDRSDAEVEFDLR
jgi:hypothetical protein